MKQTREDRKIRAMATCACATSTSRDTFNLQQCARSERRAEEARNRADVDEADGEW